MDEIVVFSKNSRRNASRPISRGELEWLGEAVAVTRVNEACTRLFHSHFHNASHFRKWIDLSEVGRRLRIICGLTCTPIGLARATVLNAFHFVVLLTSFSCCNNLTTRIWKHSSNFISKLTFITKPWLGISNWTFPILKICIRNQ